MTWAVGLVIVITVTGVAGLWLSAQDRGVLRARRLADGTQEARIVVDRGYTPSHIELEAGVPATLRFERHDDDACTETLISELWPTAHRLVANGETQVRFTPERPGRYAFTCGMGMYSGELVVFGASQLRRAERGLVWR